MVDLIERLRRIAEGGPRDFVAYASPLDYVDALGRIRRLEAKLAELEAERETDRGLLRRVVCYVIEDRARTPGFTRLTRLVDEIRSHLRLKP